MTNEKIQRIAETLYSAIANEVGKGGSAVQVPMIAQAIREAVAEAYEEAAKVADDTYEAPGWCGDYKNAAFSIAAGIRALKDSPDD